MNNQKIALFESIPYSGMPPWQVRQGDYVREDQRVKAIQLIKDNSNVIKIVSGKYNIPPESIAGAILWEAAENPYPAWRYSKPGVPAHRKLPGVAGKIHPDQWFYAYGNQKIPRTSDYLPTLVNLNNPKVAIEYIAALMDIHATNYEKIAGVNVRKSPGILATLYHGGDSYGRAVKLRDLRYQDRQQGHFPRLPSVPPKEMGEYVERYRTYLRTDLLNLNDLGLNELSSNETKKFDAADSQKAEVSKETNPKADVSKVVELLRNNSDAIKQEYGFNVNTNEGLGKAVMQYWKENKLDPKELRAQLPNIKDSEFETVSKAQTNASTTQPTKNDQRSL